MTHPFLLSGTHLSLVSSPLDSEIAIIASNLEQSVRIGGRGDLEDLFCELLAGAHTSAETAPHRTLDLIGHSTSDLSLLRLGYWVVDAARAPVRAFFRELADLDVMGRLGIRSLRLLGCETAVTAQGRSTICELSEILGIEVMGTRAMLGASHYTPMGFSNDCHHLLASSTELRGACSPTPLLHGEPYQRTLDIGALPASPMTPRRWPTAVATTEQAREIVRMIRRNDGAYMPGLDPTPRFEIGLPSMTKHGWFHTIQLVADDSFVRVFPDANGPAVVFPVDEPARLRELVQSLERVELG